MDLQYSKTGNQAKSHEISPEFVDAAVGESAGMKVVGSVDPRWPLLNRWSSPMKISSAPKTVVISSNPGSVSEPTQQIRDSPLALPSNSLDTGCHLANEIPNLAKSPCTIVRNSISGAVNPQKVLTFSTPLGAWKKPLPIVSTTSQQTTVSVTHCAEPSNTQWPSLSGQSGVKRSGFDHAPLKASKVPEDSVAQQELLKAQSKDYPWAARMNQSMRNLHRVTIPEYMEDGTPKVRIPSHVLLGGLENQKEFVVGQFYRCLAPTGGQIQAVVSRIWGRKCRIFTRKLGESTYLFHIPDESTRKWVLQRGLWHVDDCLLFVSPWSPTDTISIPEITTVPVWLTLLNIPDQLYSILGIKWIASGIGEPLLTEKPWLDPTQMGKAKILVEVKLDKPFPKRVALIDKSEAITMVDVSYSWLPSTCSGCGQLGHKVSRCLLLSSKTSRPEVSGITNKNCNTSDDSNVNGNAKNASPKMDEADVSKLCTATDCVENHETLTNAQVLVSTLVSGQDTSPITSHAKASKNIVSPTILSTSVTTENTRKIKATTKASMQEASTSKQLNSPSVKADSGIRRCLSGLSLSTNMFASLDSSEDDDSDEDDDTPPLTDEVEPIEFLTPSGKRILRERPVKPSEKAKELQRQTVTGGRGNRGRGTRGGRG